MKWLLFIFILFRFCAHAQNLNFIPNPSFESATNCYPGAGGNFQYIIDWYSATNLGSPDYFALCGDIAQPSSIIDAKRHSGNCRIGLFTYNSAGNNAREYIAVPFNDTLRSNINYCLEYFLIPRKYTKYGTNDFGAYFGTGHQLYATYNITQVSPQLTIPGADFIIDTANWYHYQGVYLAQGNETDIILGSFKGDSQILLQLYDTSSSAQSIAYLIIDDVSLYEMSINAGADALTCTQDLAATIGELNTDAAFKSYYWYDAGNTLIDSTHSQITVSPGSSTFYIEEKRLCGQSFFDTVFVKVDANCQPPVDTSDTTTIQTIIPNVFTPNNDGYNDVFEIKVSYSTINTFQIYNRWGVKVYDAKEQLSTQNSTLSALVWDGHTTGGEPCAEGVYYYILEYTNPKQEIETYRGYLSLFR